MMRVLKWIFAGPVVRALLVIAVLAGMLSGFSTLSTLDNLVYDQLVKFRSASPGPRAVVVAIDTPSIRQIGTWPWPRTYLAEMISLLAEQQVVAVGLHLFLPSHEWNSGLAGMRALREQLDLNPKKSAIGRSLVEMESSINGDQKLLQAINSSGHVVVPFLFQAESSAESGSKNQLPPGFSWELPVKNWESSLAALHNPIRNWFDRDQAQGVYSGLFSAVGTTAYQGHINYIQDHAGRVRQLSLLKPFNGKFYPSQVLQLVSLAGSKERPTINYENSSLLVNGKPVSTGEDFSLYIDPAGESAVPLFSFYDVVNGKFPEGAFRDKIILIGLTTSPLIAGGVVNVSTPPPVISAAAIVSALLDDRQIFRPYWAFLFETASILYLGIFLILVLPRLKLSLGWLLQGVFLLGWVIIVATLLVLKGMWFQVAPHLVLVLGGLLVLTLQRTLTRQGLNYEDLKLLGLSFQSQGMLDMAFDKFRQCPVQDKAVREILYNLGLDFERKRMFNKAIAVYSHLLKGGRFKDAKKKISELTEMEKSVVLGGNGSRDGTMILGKGATSPTLGRYEVLRELGQGAMGTVYLGRDPKINREVAIKTLNLHDVEPDQLREVKERFFREAEAAGKLNHPHIVTIYDAGEEHDLAYMAMEYLIGKDLSAHCSKKSLLPVPTVLKLAAEVADALAYAHNHNVVHRDIKPSNLMLLKNGQIKVTDFGIARVVNSSQTQTGTILGTPSYMSPEQVSGEKVRGRSDLFSLGVVCYELLSGEKPFVGDSLGALMHNIANVKYTPLRKVNPKLPESCYAVVRKLLKKDFKDRYKTATEVAEALRKCLEKAG